MTDEEALAPFRRVTRLEGIIPALETAHALHYALASRRPALDLVCCSGRGDKDLAEVLARTWDRRTGMTRRRRAHRRGVRRSGKRAALMPYLMGGFPDARHLAGDRRGVRRRRRRPRRARRAVLRPARRRAGDPRGGHRGRSRRARPSTACSRSARRSPRASRSCSCATRTSSSRAAAERSPRRLADAGASGLIVPDLPLEEARRRRSRPATPRGIALVPLVAPTTPDERLSAIGARARGFLYTVSVTGTTGERSGGADTLRADRRARQGATPRPGRARLRDRHARARRRAPPTRAPTA